MEHIPGTMIMLTVKDPDEFLREVKSLGGYTQAIDAWIDDMNKQFEPYNFKIEYRLFAECLSIGSINHDKHPLVSYLSIIAKRNVISTVQDVYKFRECVPTLINLMQLVKDHPEMFKRVEINILNQSVTLERCTNIGEVRTEMKIMTSLKTMRDTEAELTLTVDELDYQKGNYEFATERLTPVVETFWETVDSTDNLAECVETLAIKLNEQAMRESILLRLYK